MDTESFWRSRTVSEAMSQGHFLRLICACGRITDYPFALLLQRRGVSPESFNVPIGMRSQAHTR
jgi:hypothetical protein